jgi:hypothetical protein
MQCEKLYNLHHKTYFSSVGFVFKKKQNCVRLVFKVVKIDRTFFENKIYTIQGTLLFFVDFKIAKKVRWIRLNFLPEIWHLKWRDTCSRKKFSQGLLKFLENLSFFIMPRKNPNRFCPIGLNNFLQVPMATCQR